MDIVSLLAVRRAWALARAHHHFWSSIDCSPENLRRAALARELAAAKAEVEAGILGAYTRRDAVEEAIGEMSLEEVCGEWPPRPPATREEAELIGFIHHYWGGVTYVVSPSGRHHYTTSTGRTNWSVNPDGTTYVSIDRPGAVGVVNFTVSPKGEYRLEVAPYEGWDRSAKRSSGARHVGAALTCALALGVPGLVRQLRIAVRAGLMMDLEGLDLPEGSEERHALEASIRTLGEELAA